MDTLARLPLDRQEGNARGIVQAVLAQLDAGERGALVIVLETEGSTYARAGTPVLFGEHGHQGWISGGCLEPDIQRRAQDVATSGHIDWMEIDTRDDAAMFSGSAVGCRGCQRIVMLPVAALLPARAALAAWLRGPEPLQWAVHSDGAMVMRCGSDAVALQMPARPLPWAAPRRQWRLQWHRAPHVLLLGAGPEAAPLVPLLQGLGWQVDVAEPRETWRSRAVGVSACSDASVLLAETRSAPDAALVMHHNFELDLQALERLAPTATRLIGLLGPERRRDDLFSLLPADTVAALLPRLRSPAGLSLGGRGAEAIALSIAAQLQAWRHATPLDRH